MDIWRFFSGHTACNPEIGPQNQKSALPQLFGLTTAFPNGMTQPCSTNEHGSASLQGIVQGTSQGLPREDWAVVLPTQKILQTNLTSQENFIQIHSPVQKLFMISCITDWRTHKLHTKQITPLPYMGAGGNLFLPCFLYLSQNGVSEQSELTPICSDKLITYWSEVHGLSTFTEKASTIQQ